MARKHPGITPRLLTPGSPMGRMVDREPQPSGGLTVRVRIRGRDQRPEQEKHWPEEPQEALEAQDEEVTVTIVEAPKPPPATPAAEVSEDPVTVADEMYEDVVTAEVA